MRGTYIDRGLFILLVQKFKTVSISFINSELVRILEYWSEYLTLLWQRPLSYRNQSTDLRSKSMDWFLYDNGLRHERVKREKYDRQKMFTLRKNWNEWRKFYLVNREELIDTDIHTAQLLNSFSNVVKKLKITNIKTVTLSSHLIKFHLLII